MTEDVEQRFYSEFVEALGEAFRKRARKPTSLTHIFMQKVATTLYGLLCSVRIYGASGLERWIGRKLSLSRGWRARVTQRKARRFYRDSV